MLKIIGTIGAMLAIVGFIATSTLLTGIPGLTQISPRAVPAEAADTDGFPSGRRLADDVTDIELRVIAG